MFKPFFCGRGSKNRKASPSCGARFLSSPSEEGSPQPDRGASFRSLHPPPAAVATSHVHAPRAARSILFLLPTKKHTLTDVFLVGRGRALPVISTICPQYALTTPFHNLITTDILNIMLNNKINYR